jgi:YfiH family protein
VAAGTQTIQLPAPFAWVGEHIGVELGHGARAVFTTRRGGVSPSPFDTLNLGRWSDDDAANVERNRERVAAIAGVPLDRLAQGRQVHGTHVETVTATPHAIVDADAVITELSDAATLVLTADCMPIALATPRAVGMVHAGWRGLADGVIEAAVHAIRDDDEPVVAAIGPAAGGCCYEVGDDVREELCADPCGEPALIDLRRIAHERLYASDVDVVHDVRLCTMCTPPELFFSHRRDGPVTGRQGGIAWRPSS